MSVSSKQRNKRRTALVVSVLFIAAAIFFWRVGNSGDLPTAVAAEAKTVFPSLPKQVEIKESQVEKEELVDDESIKVWQEIQARPVKTELHQSLLSDLAKFHRYPPENRAIKNPSQDPITQTHAPDQRTTHSDNGDALTLWTERKFYSYGEVLRAYAFQTDSDGAKVPADLTALMVLDDQQVVGTLTFSDTNGDLIYEVEMEAGSYQGQPLPAGIYKIIVDTDIDGLRDAAAFTLSEDTGSYTGNLRDSLTSEGNLLIEAEVEILEQGRFYFRASLYNDEQSSIGTTQNALQLPPGRHWIPFDFYGLMIRDADQDGPYLVKQLSISRVTVPRTERLFEPGYYTERYSLEQFNDTPYKEL
ncbi:hypothetical protein Misp06_04274 [Microbulbifer sp. NBRC 101763]|uniref:hypothetical protein n=1 Tax=unclassified Microbulbifer TaxID=2619833 RepID=UPI0024ACBDB7|nr:hypothetical protein [Microbulbifer sp. MLAF003]WHI50708.1 hypothetical protein P3339_20125 [Microbulbifer sp. MLAF003]